MKEDFIYAIRGLLKDSRIVVLAIILLALGIGASGGMFMVLYGVLLHPLPFAQSQNLVRIGQFTQLNDHPGTASIPDIGDWRTQSKSFEQIAYWALNSQNSPDTGGVPLVVVESSFNLFSTLQAQVFLGRTFDREDEVKGYRNVAVLSAALWRKAFASDRAIVGRSIKVGPRECIVLGVMADGFTFPMSQETAAVWMPIEEKKEWEDRATAMVEAIGRLRPGVSIPSAQAELTTIFQRSPGRSISSRLILEEYRKSVSGDVSRSLWLLQSGVMVIWGITCLNVIGLLLIRATDRRREVTIRVALGASRLRLLRQFLLESLLFSGLAALIGLLLAIVAVRACQFYLASQVPFAHDIRVNIPVLLFITALTSISSLLFGILPALAAPSSDLQHTLREGTAGTGTGRQRIRLQHGLAVIEIAMSIVLLVSAGLLFRTISILQAVPLGFQPGHLVVSQIFLPVQIPGFSEARSIFYQTLIERLQSVPGIKSAAISTALPMNPNSTFEIPVQIFGKSLPSSENERAQFRIVSSLYHQTMGMQLLSGRLFAESDRMNQPWAVIINHAFAERYFAGQYPIGQRIKTASAGAHEFSPIVGVVADVPQRSLFEPPQPEIDICDQQLAPTDDLAFVMTLSAQVAVRTGIDPTAAVPIIQKNIAGIVPEGTPYSVTTMQQVVDGSLLNQIFAGRLLWIFAGVALLIALIGFYGILMNNVKSRSKEIGVRLALGAQSREVFAMIMKNAAALLMLGSAIGIALSLVVGRFVRYLLYGIGASDPVTIGCATVLLWLCGLGASYIPAMRACRIDPLASIRDE